MELRDLRRKERERSLGEAAIRGRAERDDRALVGSLRQPVMTAVREISEVGHLNVPESRLG